LWRVGPKVSKIEQKYSPYACMLSHHRVALGYRR
jgi:hypothetical protein